MSPYLPLFVFSGGGRQGDILVFSWCFAGREPRNSRMSPLFLLIFFISDGRLQRGTLVGGSLVALSTGVVKSITVIPVSKAPGALRRAAS